VGAAGDAGGAGMHCDNERFPKRFPKHFPKLSLGTRL